LSVGRFEQRLRQGDRLAQIKRVPVPEGVLERLGGASRTRAINLLLRQG
jgi:hypothetical protein